ncbi:DgyrCDS8815 [Dimorphilus gyrociliatus]|uniref:Ras-related protein Rab n=1 Tax=Dimorphilus gyrociliatus TaxID=2664684 RepID=A0A7I8W0F7_9ANNE|nr:DgyrCDS8815 [Dimorphilus gyrociliatus]
MTATLTNGEQKEHLYKVLVIGELGSGKTSIIKRYVHQFFSQHYRATILFFKVSIVWEFIIVLNRIFLKSIWIGVDFALKVINWDADTVIRLQLWDIAGQERFGNMTRVYYKEAVGAFVVFDITRASTFEAVQKWKSDLDSKVQLPDGSPLPCVLLANKCDQNSRDGIVNDHDAMEEYCRERGFANWFETSAKENINIDEAARCLVTKILQNDSAMEYGQDHGYGDQIVLDGKPPSRNLPRSKNNNCC